MARATVPPQAFNSAVDLPRARLGRGSGRSGPGRAVDQAAQLATSAWAVAPSRAWGPTGLEPRICLDGSFLRSCDHSARGNLSLSACGRSS